MSDNARLRNALKRVNRKLAAEEWLYGLVGKITASGPIYDVPGRAGFIYVRLRNSNGAQTTPPARNDPGVPQSAGLPVRMYYEGTTLVIDSVNRRPDLATVDPPPASGVPLHIHDDRYFRENEHINTSAGAADAAKPVVLGATGLLSNTFLDIELSSIAGLTSAADRLPYYTGLGTASLATFTAFARTFLDDADAATVRATLGLIIGTNVQAQDAELQAIAGLTSAADRLAYFTGSGTAALATFTAFARTLIDDIDAAAARTTLALGTIATEAAANYALLAGRAGGQTLKGGTASGDDLTLMSSNHATKGSIFFGSSAYDEVNNYLGIDILVPLYAVDITTSVLRSQMHFSGTNADSGGYMVSASANNFFMSGGAHFDAGPWVAKSTSAGIFGTQLGHFDWFADTGLTAGNNFTPTQLMFLDAAGLGIGTETPKGKLHVHDGTGGLLFVTKTGIVGAAQTIIPDGVGDVTKGVKISGLAFNAVPQVVDVSGQIVPGGTIDETIDGGTNMIRFAVSAAGALTVIRQAGASTWSISVQCVWQ